MPDFTQAETEDARNNPRPGDVWDMCPDGAWKREVGQVDIEGVWFDSSIGREWLTNMCDTRDEWAKNTRNATLVRRGDA